MLERQIGESCNYVRERVSASLLMSSEIGTKSSGDYLACIDLINLFNLIVCDGGKYIQVPICFQL